MTRHTNQDTQQNTVSFGHQRVTRDAKPGLVDDVFARVAQRYDLMNDLMSLGSHRVLKRVALEQLSLRPGQRVLDLAGGTGDIARLIADRVGASGSVVVADANADMMRVGRDRLLDQAVTSVVFCQTMAENLPFDDGAFDRVTIGFGLRNFTDKLRALTEVHRVLKPGGVLLVLEFSRATHPGLANAYGLFQSLWPGMGRLVVGDASPYRYLVESIREHPGQEALALILRDAGFTAVEYQNLLGGIVAIHRGERPEEIGGPRS